MDCRRWTSLSTTLAPAVFASPSSSSSGSAVIHGLSGRATLTKRARSWWTVNLSRVISSVTVGLAHLLLDLILDVQAQRIHRRIRGNASGGRTKTERDSATRTGHLAYKFW